MRDLLLEAFERTCQGYSPDRIVADPELNDAFLEECVRLGILESAKVLNRALLNLRKSGGLRGKKSKRTTFPNQADYLFASEIAVRFLERRDHVSLDDIICDPALALEFDQVASRVYPNVSPLQYRWAALSLRKAQRLQPELLARIEPPISIETFQVINLDVAKISREQGLYLFYTTHHVLYVGEAENLQTRIRKHIDHSDNKGLARWLWQFGPDELHLEIQVLDKSTTLRIRRALESELIGSRKPVFNVQR